MQDAALSRARLPRPQRFARVAGAILALVSLLFVGERIWASRAFFAAGSLDAALAVVVGAAAVGYAGLSVLLALAWRRSLLRFGGGDAGARACIAVYGRTQIAKYVPGNVFHWVGRHALARRLGYPDTALAWAALNEAVTVALAAGGIALTAGATRSDASAVTSVPALAALVALLALAALCVDPLVTRVSAWRGVPAPGAGGGPRAVAVPLLQVTAFTAGSGALLLGIAVAICGAPALAHAGLVLSGAAVSWLTGFVTPGASAGAGVREAVLILWLGPLLGAAESTGIALAWRVVTVAGDALFFATTLRMKAGPR